MEKIKVDNANAICLRTLSSGDVEQKAKAWTVVYDYLRQRGMKGSYVSKRVEGNLTGIENVISFLETNLKKRITP